MIDNLFANYPVGTNLILKIQNRATDPRLSKMPNFTQILFDRVENQSTEIFMGSQIPSPI